MKIRNLKNMSEISTDNMKTFKNLYEYLQSNEINNIHEWINDNWNGKEKQESLLRLFAGLGLIKKLDKYKICKGNYNNGTVEVMNSMKDIFYNNKNEEIFLNDKGDKSDLHGLIINQNGKNIILATSSKNINKENIGNYDLRDIKCIHYEKYKDYELHICLCVRNKQKTLELVKNANKTNKDLKDLLMNKTTIIIDWDDLKESYYKFKQIYNNISINQIINNNKPPLKLKMHQQITVDKTMKIIEKSNNNILWGHIPRSGKSYIIGGTIISDSILKENSNYLILTTAINDTEEQYYEVFNCLQFKDFNIKTVNQSKLKEVKESIKHSNKNIIIVSDMYLKNTQGKISDDQEENEEKINIKKIKFLKDLNFDIAFFDESHQGMGTKLAKEIINYYVNKTFKIFITATYSKPVNNYNISKENCILWDMEDINLCRNIDNLKNQIILNKKHKININNYIDQYSIEELKAEYNKYPNLYILTHKLEDNVKHEIIANTKNNDMGWSPQACLLTKQSVEIDSNTNQKIIKKYNELQNEKEALNMWYLIFGKYDKYGIPDDKYPNDKVFMKRIENICKNGHINSRYIGDIDEPIIIMCYMPLGSINETIEANIKLLNKYNVIPDFDILHLNSSNPKKDIKDATNKAKINNKKGILVLTGKRCCVGVTIKNCDIVIMLNNLKTFDMIYQIMFRCMNDGINKKCGFVIDLNLDRVIETSLIEYSNTLKPDSNTKDGIKYLLQERIVNINPDHWMECFGNSKYGINDIIENSYNKYLSNTENALQHYISKLQFKELQLTNEEQKSLDTMFKNVVISNNENFNEKDENIKDGIKKIEVLDDNIIVEDNNIMILIENNNNNDKNNDINTFTNTVGEKDKKYEKKNYMEILRHIIPLLCIFTIHNKENNLIDMYNIIKNNSYLSEVLYSQIITWWGKNIKKEFIVNLINIYKNYMADDKHMNDTIKTIKNIFIKSKNDTNKLSKLIDTYLIPQELEKKSNAEVSTPFELREEMLNKLPFEFWKSKKKYLNHVLVKVDLLLILLINL